MVKKANITLSKGEAGIILVLLAVSLIAGSLVLLKKTQTTNYTPTSVSPTASLNTDLGLPVLYYNLDPVAVSPGQNFDLAIMVDPNDIEFHAFELYLTYESEKIEFQNNANLSQNIISTYPLIRSSIDSSARSITIIGTKLGSPFSGSEGVEIARVKMKVKASASGDLVFGWGQNSKLGNKIDREVLNATVNIQ